MATLGSLVIVCFVIQLAAAAGGSDIWCLSDGSTQPVDWWVAYKQPSGSTKYFYLDNSTASRGWTMSEHGINDVNSFLQSTLRQMETSAAYLFYNDEIPSNKRSSQSNGHAKGILGFGEDGSGLWIMHSIPKFPAVDNETGKTSPVDVRQLEYAQMAICISLNASGMAEAAEQIRYVQPQLYAKRGSSDDDALKKLNESAQSLWTKRPKWVRQPPYSRETNLSTRGGSVALKGFAKSKKLMVDIYGSMIAPKLGLLMVESWRRGSGQPLPSNCSSVETLNVQDVALGPSWSTTDDHSKWAVAQARYACVGDLNRMKSQFFRGGGAICLDSEAVSEAFRAAVKDVQTCPTNDILQHQSLDSFY